MSYLPARRSTAVAGFFDFDPIRGASFSDSTCFADADARTADMYAKQQALQNNWNPTGYYTPDDMKAVNDAAFQMMTAAGAVLDKALAGSQDLTSRGQLMDARDAIFDQESKALPFTDAIRNALATGVEIIDSSGFKRWVIGTMEVAKAAMFTAYYVACNRAPLLDLLISAIGALTTAADYFVALVTTVAGVVKAAVDLALAAGKQIIKIPDYIGTITTVALVGVAAVGAWWLWKTFGKKTATANPARRRRRR